MGLYVSVSNAIDRNKIPTHASRARNCIFLRALFRHHLLHTHTSIERTKKRFLRFIQQKNEKRSKTQTVQSKVKKGEEIMERTI
jgi:ferritin-like metal-binding protein YciE